MTSPRKMALLLSPDIVVQLSVNRKRRGLYPHAFIHRHKPIGNVGANPLWLPFLFEVDFGNGWHRFVAAQTIITLAINGLTIITITQVIYIVYIIAHSPSGKMGSANIIHTLGATRFRGPWVNTRWHCKFIVRFLTNARTGLAYCFNPHYIGLTHLGN